MIDNKIYDSFSSEIKLVFEKLAAAVHEQWTKGRLEEGWSLGAVRNDSLKQTPCLVPYDELPELEKDYDRNTVLCVIDTLQKYGFAIERRRI